MAFLNTTTGKLVNQGGAPGSAGVSTGVPGTGAGGVPGTAGAGGSASTSYLDIIQNDPLYRQLLSDLSAQGVSDEAGARAQAQRGFINFGETEGFDQPYSRWVDEPTRALASRNTEAGLSIKARLGKQQKDNVRAIRNALASRGALQSGEFGHQLGEENLRYTQAQYDSRQQLTDYLTGISSALAMANRQRAAQQSQGISDAVGRAPQTPPGGGGGGGGGGSSTPPTQPGSPWTVGPGRFQDVLPKPPAWTVGPGRFGDFL